MIRGNVSKTIRDQGVLTATSNSIYRVAGTALRDAITDEFEKLVYETPQFTGTTAASWKIGFYGTVDKSMIKMPDIKNGQDALARGMDPACSIAIQNARFSLTNEFEDYAKRDIVLFNEAPGFETAEEGPVRAVNTPPGALKRFESRIATLDILVDFPKL